MTKKEQRTKIEQEELLEYKRNGKSAKEIANTKGVALSTVYDKLAKIDPKLLKEAEQEWQQREQEELLEYKRNGKSAKEIANTKGVALSTVYDKLAKIDPKLLKEAEQEWQQREQEELLEYKRNGKSVKEIADIKGVLISAIYNKLAKIDPKLLKEAEQEWQQREQEELLNYKRNGKSTKEIEDIKCVSMGRKLAKIDPKLVEEAKQEWQQREQEELLEYKRNGKSAKEIANTKGVALSTVYDKLAKIDPKLLKEAEQEWQQREQEELLEYKRNGKSVKEIADIKGVSMSTIYNKLAKIAPELVKEAKRKGKQKQEKSDAGIGNISIIKEKIKSREITQNDVKKYRCMVDEKYNEVSYDEVITLIRAYIATKQITEGIRFLNMIINNQDFQYLGIEKIKDMKIQVENIQKRQIARRLLRAEEKIPNIVQQTGLKETEIIEMKKQAYTKGGISLGE